LFTLNTQPQWVSGEKYGRSVQEHTGDYDRVEKPAHQQLQNTLDIIKPLTFKRKTIRCFEISHCEAQLRIINSQPILNWPFLVGFGPFAGLEDRLFLKIVLLGEYYEKERIELNNMGTNYYLCCILAVCVFRIPAPP
jgi:hypothetical protein